MSRARIAILGLLFVGAALAAGCGGGGGGSAFTPHGGGASNGGTSVQVKIVVPQKVDAKSGRRTPKFVSASTKSAVILIFAVPSTSPSASASPPPFSNVGNNYVNISPTSPGCTTTAGATTCTVSVPTSITTAGTYVVGVFTYDAAQTASCIPTSTTPPCAGNVLAVGAAESTITPGSANPVNVSLGGIPAFFQPVELLSGMIGGTSMTQTQLMIFGPGQAQAQFELLDVDKNVILGSSPIVTLTSGSPAVLAALVSTTPGPTGLYTITLQAQTTTVGGQPIVTATTVPLTFTVLAAGAGAPITVSGFSVTIQHSVMYVARAITAGVLTVDEYLDGNTTPAVSDYSAGDNQLGLAVDQQENLWIADTGNNDIVVFPLELPGATPSQAWTFCGIGTTGCTGSGHSLSTTFANPTFLSFDDNGNLYVSALNAGINQVQQYNAPSPGSTPNPSGTTPVVLNGSPTLYFCHSTLDNMGYLYVGTSAPALDSWLPGPSSPTMINAANINGIGWAPDGTLWYLNQPVSGNDSAIKLNVLSSTTQNTISGIANNTNQGLAVDSLGNVYVATGAGTGVSEWTAASNWATMTTVGNSLAPTFVAVYPDGLFGANNEVGVANPNQTPIPIPTPSGGL